MKVYKYSELLESYLKLVDLAKDGENGLLRGDEFIRKIKDGEELTLTDGDQIIVDPSNEIIKKISTVTLNKYKPELGSKYFRYNKKAILDTNGEYHQLKEIEKTIDFGGGPSVSGKKGKDTRIVESIQCLVLSYRQHQERPLDEDDYDDLSSLSQGDLNRYLSYTDTGMETGTNNSIRITSKMLEEYGPNWSSTFLKTANALYNPKTRIFKSLQSETILKKGITYRFCHMSSKGGVVEAINNAYSILSKKMEGWESINMAKWMPADMWAVDIESDTEADIRNEIQSCESINDLNNLIDYYFGTKQLVGISLKKIAEGKKIIMIINKVTSLPKYTLRNFRLAKTTDAMSTTCIKMVANRRNGREIGEESMTIRSFNSGQNILGEVDGSAAAHGKISLNKINEILSRNKLNIVPTTKEIKEWWNTNQLRQQIKNINNLIIDKYGEGVITRSISREYQETPNRLVTKYQALFLSWILSVSTKAEIVDKVVEEMFLYALSIKITTNTTITRTPKYVRIVD